MSTPPSFVCRTCGKEHPGLPTDWGFALPDEVFAVGYIEKYGRARHNSDLCTLDESRFFVRALLPIPRHAQDEPFAWGIWTEVSKSDHDQYVAHFNVDASALPPFTGRIANSIPGYVETIGQTVIVQTGRADKRPLLKCLDDSSHALAVEQRQGISVQRHHDLLDACGFFKDTPRAA